MCTNCTVMAEVFASAAADPHANYLPALRQLDIMAAHGRLRMVYGDCPPAKAEDLLADGLPGALVHYFQCPMCRLYFKIGAQPRETPFFHTQDSIKDELAGNKRTVWDTFLEFLDGTG